MEITCGNFRNFSNQRIVILMTYNSSGFRPVLTSTLTPSALPSISATSGAMESLTNTRFITFSKIFFLN